MGKIWIVLFMLIGGVCMAEDLKFEQDKNYFLEVSANASDDYTIKFTDAPNCKVWFDRKDNKWKYDGDIEKIGDAIFKLANQPYCPELIPIMIEIYRQLKAK